MPLSWLHRKRHYEWCVEPDLAQRMQAEQRKVEFFSSDNLCWMIRNKKRARLRKGLGGCCKYSKTF